ncbi:hypothetical protein MASR2M18_21910 [Ignavibacteria bacterium]
MYQYCHALLIKTFIRRARSILTEIASGVASAESVERLTANMYVPRDFSARTQILYRALKDAEG